MDNRYIGGTVNANGTVKYEGEFSANRTSEGHYLISFRPAFQAMGGGAVTQIYGNDGDTRDNAVIIRLTNTEVFIKTGDSAGNAKDRDFTFVFAGVGSAPAK